MQLERRIDQVNSLVEDRIKSRLFDEFGVTVSSVDIAVIDVDKTSDGYQQLKSVTQDLTTATMQARAEVDIREMKDSQRLGVFERAGRTFTDIREGAYARRKKTQSENLAAYQTEVQEHVGVAGAHGLGMMGVTGGIGGGLNPASMMAGMQVGSAIGQNIAGNISTVMAGVYQQTQTQQPSAPPPIQQVVFNVAVNGQPTGPFDLPTLSQMIASGVWERYP